MVSEAPARRQGPGCHPRLLSAGVLSLTFGWILVCLVDIFFVVLILLTHVSLEAVRELVAKMSEQGPAHLVLQRGVTNTHLLDGYKWCMR